MAFRKTITWKILLLFASLAGSLLFAGVALSYFIEQQNEEAVRENLAEFFQRAHTVLAESEQQLGKRGELLGSRQGLVSSLNLINDYTDIDNYQPLVFDGEKQRLAAVLSAHARSAGLQHVALYDADGWLVAFSDSEFGHAEEGFISFKQGEPVIYAQPVDGEGDLRQVVADPYWRSFLRQSSGQYGSFLVRENGNIAMAYSGPVTRMLPDGSSKVIGHVRLMRHLDDGLLIHIGQGTAVRYSIQTEDRIVVGSGPRIQFEHVAAQALALTGTGSGPVAAMFKEKGNYLQVRRLSVSDGDNALLVASLDRSLMDQQVAQTRNVVLWVLILAALVVLPVGLAFAHYGITRPTEILTRQARMIHEGRYDLSEVQLDTRELNTVAKALHEAAQTICERETELRRTHSELELRVDERTRDLAEANARLGEEVLERKQAECEMNASRDMLQKVIDHIPQFVFWKDRDSAYLGCNRNFLDAAGLNKVDEIVGKTDYDMPWSREEADFYREMDRRVMDSDQEELHIQETQHTAEGGMIFVDTNKVPLHGADGEVIGILGTYEDITERVENQMAMLLAKEEAVKANQAKSEFLSRMSHELRTPLNAILGFAQLLEIDSSNSLSQRQSEGVTEIRRAGKHLLELINQMLDLARIESGRIEIHAEAVDIDRLLSGSLTLVESLLESRNIRISYKPEERGALRVYADPLRLRQVVLNLLSNGVKYNVDGGDLEVSVRQLDERRLRVGVRDTGIGISGQDQKRLFQPFVRLGDSTDLVEGTGIGLVISRELIELMGGEMGVHSMLGAGSEFWFILPLADHAQSTPVTGGQTTETEAEPVEADVRRHVL